LDTDSATDDEVDIPAFGWVIDDIKVRVIGALFCTRLCQSPGVVDFGKEDFDVA